MLKLLYRIYQVCIYLPLGLLSTAFFGLLTSITCTMWRKNADWWGNFAGRGWGRSLVHLALLPVKVEGRENIERGKSYILVANHQGCFDIFLVFGFINRPIRWMMKKSLEKVPFVGRACRNAGQVFVDKSGPHAIKETYDNARKALKGGASLMVFPEGRRTWTGEMGKFQRSAFLLADELQLPIVPITINGSYDVMPRQRDFHFVHWHRLTLTIHKPIPPTGQGAEHVKQMMDKSYEAIKSGLE